MTRARDISLTAADAAELLHVLGQLYPAYPDTSRTIARIEYGLSLQLFGLYGRLYNIELSRLQPNMGCGPCITSTGRILHTHLQGYNHAGQANG